MSVIEKHLFEGQPMKSACVLARVCFLSVLGVLILLVVFCAPVYRIQVYDNTTLDRPESPLGWFVGVPVGAITREKGVAGPWRRLSVGPPDVCWSENIDYSRKWCCHDVARHRMMELERDFGCVYSFCVERRWEWGWYGRH